VLAKNNRISIFKIGGLIYLLGSKKEFKNLFNYRIGFVGLFLKRIFPDEKTLFINSTKIGKGLYLEHGFSTIILANSIGNNCWINQQVTIGYIKEECQ
jgi:serine O-acetyltransferase